MEENRRLGVVLCFNKYPVQQNNATTIKTKSFIDIIDIIDIQFNIFVLILCLQFADYNSYL